MSLIMSNKNQCIFRSDRCSVYEFLCGFPCLYFFISLFLFFESVIFSCILGIDSTDNSKSSEYLYPWINIQTLIISNMFMSAIMLFSDEKRGLNWYTILTSSVNLIFRFWSLVILTHVVINNKIAELNSKVWNCMIESTVVFCVVTIISSVSGIVWCCKRSCARALENQRELNRVKKELDKTKKQLEGTTALPYSVEIEK